jgi:PKD repeat protein
LVPFPVRFFRFGGCARAHGPPPPNVFPVASFVFSCVGLTCSFTDTSLDPDGAIMAWSWKKGNGSTSSKQNTTVTYAAPGSYTVKLTVTDSRGATKSVSRKVTGTG